MDPAEKRKLYAETLKRTHGLLTGEDDWIAAMSTVACELHHAFPYFHWTGFYRHVGSELLVIGPYQGGHGCLRIQFNQGVCGAAAREKRSQVVEDVNAFPGHIACSLSTKSEIVVPILNPDGDLLGVLDVDSDDLAAFDTIDQAHLEQLCETLGQRFPNA